MAFFFLVAVMPMAAGNKYVLVIDAGHGGRDAGAVGSFSKEKDINLKVALSFGRYVENNCPDVKVIYTRKKDVFLELYERADIANKNHADVFVSIHTNALPRGHVGRGVETYSMTLRRSEEKLSAAMRENSVITYEEGYQERYAGYDSGSEESAIMFEYIHDENMAKSVELAKSIQKNLCSAANRPNKGVKQDNFHVLRRTSMPACLVELGFISTPDEERLLNDESAIDRMGYGIYAGFVKYMDKNSVVTPYKAGAETQIALPTVAPQKKNGGQSKTDNRRTEKSNKPADGGNLKQKGAGETASQGTSDSSPQASDKLTYKVQFMTATSVLKEGAALFKGVTGAEYYKDGSVYKYTIGDCETLSEAAKLKKEMADKFPDAFIIKFRNGQRVR
ncbi:MAG: N-acetylmuramoyl-L-alanine amidase [Bacteroidales bacterium]|nr:N-acetylmuramoyl-L-alanine amidase [Bacteroidales bacterium]MCM1147861.1 N-acetylmuramoyl-L-alanine amidase [Bacteroidales bacterium]MCM1206704.1 N-acetylmuramoyl-L-alanine amidase [Bacillota bacterium]MCM1510900.1 N-acetylmuramoyl-L-alanine amidase [Clostridium sp.]